MGSIASDVAAPSQLFSPFKIGNLELKHRIVMAPLTRFRNDENHVPLPFVSDYYAERASVPGTFIIAESTVVSPRAAGYSNLPGIWSKDQIASWKRVTTAVHAKGSYIFLQLWALGRVADKEIAEKEGMKIVSSSNISMDSDHPEPEALSYEEIQILVADFGQGAKNAIEAGFDGIEVHGANGYLVDQFIQDVANQRTDEYGGSIDRRNRFALEVAKAAADAIGAKKVGFRISPFSTFQSMKMADPYPQFSALVKGLKALGLAYLHVVESRIAGDNAGQGTEKIDFLLDIWGDDSPFLIAGGWKPDTAQAAMDDQYKDKNVAIVFGRYFLATPDLPFRIRRGLEPNRYNRDLFYAIKTKDGYLDYKFSKEWEEASKHGLDNILA
ncbi:putative nadh:flavin oxidoreductase nadh oxidase family protein [Phaeoacremonium minimum UCRPA7]|uniref:Putative nadh:flavin oxidoreductase nadh oxidase family protein n=1 Tax=Phaeoacremonium minimum (strain UCR-PA7) TaxID=1286976 RepID=R8BQG8_PHAM7|nr:putative nadh:flavin oxidoreductase nadh oxidase family protein [Phaeoacremonium minimum UCRPA7]EOO01601.1 putative nadh:flavin oxidoreductase nadh oxidase family protein [Phaeoacremonium minimum UCRPA7]